MKKSQSHIIINTLDEATNTRTSVGTACHLGLMMNRKQTVPMTLFSFHTGQDRSPEQLYDLS